MKSFLQSYSSIVLALAGLGYFVYNPTSASAAVAIVLIGVRALEVWKSAMTNKELEERLNEAIEISYESNRLTRDTINRFIAAINPIAMSAGLQLNAKDIIGKTPEGE
jgi:predicted PP-loop superfamily ATPase